MEYKIIYEIQVDAGSPKEAALEVENVLKNGDYRPFLIVTDEQGNVNNIDLETDTVLEEDGNKFIKILQHNISYFYGDTDLEMDSCEQNHVKSLICQGYCEGELNMTDPVDYNEIYSGYWKIIK